MEKNIESAPAPKKRQVIYLHNNLLSGKDKDIMIAIFGCSTDATDANIARSAMQRTLEEYPDGIYYHVKEEVITDKMKAQL